MTLYRNQMIVAEIGPELMSPGWIDLIGIMGARQRITLALGGKKVLPHTKAVGIGGQRLCRYRISLNRSTDRI